MIPMTEIRFPPLLAVTGPATDRDRAPAHGLARGIEAFELLLVPPELSHPPAQDEGACPGAERDTPTGDGRPELPSGAAALTEMAAFAQPGDVGGGMAAQTNAPVPAPDTTRPDMALPGAAMPVLPGNGPAMPPPNLQGVSGTGHTPGGRPTTGAMSGLPTAAQVALATDDHAGRRAPGASTWPAGQPDADSLHPAARDGATAGAGVAAQKPEAPALVPADRTATARSPSLPRPALPPTRGDSSPSAVQATPSTIRPDAPPAGGPAGPWAPPSARDVTMALVATPTDTAENDRARLPNLAGHEGKPPGERPGAEPALAPVEKPADPMQPSRNAASPPGGAGSTPATAPSIIAQISAVARGLPDGPVEIRLSPEELGRVQLSLQRGETMTTVLVVAERPETLELMRRNIAELARELGDLGHAGLSFSFAQGHAQPQSARAAPEAATAIAVEGPPPPNQGTTTPPAPLPAGRTLDLRL